MNTIQIYIYIHVYMYLFVYAYVYMYAYVRIISNQHWNINLREWCIPGYYVGVVDPEII